MIDLIAFFLSVIKKIIATAEARYYLILMNRDVLPELINFIAIKIINYGKRKVSKARIHCTVIYIIRFWTHHRFNRSLRFALLSLASSERIAICILMTHINVFVISVSHFTHAPVRFHFTRNSLSERQCHLMKKSKFHHLKTHPQWL